MNVLVYSARISLCISMLISPGLAQGEAESKSSIHCEIIFNNVDLKEGYPIWCTVRIHNDTDNDINAISLFTKSASFTLTCNGKEINVNKFVPDLGLEYEYDPVFVPRKDSVDLRVFLSRFFKSFPEEECEINYVFSMELEPEDLKDYVTCTNKHIIGLKRSSKTDIVQSLASIQDKITKEKDIKIRRKYVDELLCYTSTEAIPIIASAYYLVLDPKQVIYALWSFDNIKADVEIYNIVSKDYCYYAKTCLLKRDKTEIEKLLFVLKPPANECQKEIYESLESAAKESRRTEPPK